MLKKKTLSNDLAFRMPQLTSSKVTVGYNARLEPNYDNCAKKN